MQPAFEAGFQLGELAPEGGDFGLELAEIEVNEESPAAKAGIEAGDIILSVNGEKVTSLDRFYQRVWQSGPAGVDVPMPLLHGVDLRTVVVRSIVRKEYMRRKAGI